jgi:cytochrome c nitrite reductase small subunit
MRFAGVAQAILGLAIGSAVGLGAFTFVYARGYSYLTDDPKACANCHAMQGQYAGWMKGSHRSVATCNDCHTPSGFVGKYMTKGSNGFWHSFYFTTGWYPDPIQIRPGNREVTNRACRKCHGDVTQAIEGPHGESGASQCVRCHGSVGHL